MGEYLRKYRSELARNEIDTQVELEQSILCGSTIRPDGTVERREGIRSRRAKIDLYGEKIQYGTVSWKSSHLIKKLGR